MEDKRNLILAGAARVLEREGVQLTIEQVAQESGVAKGTVYLYFSSKNDLFQQLLLMETDLLVDTLVNARNQASDNVQQLIAMLTAHYRFVAGRFPMIHRLQSLDPEVLCSVKDGILQRLFALQQKYVEVLEAGIKTGEFRRHQSEVVATGLLALVHNLVWTTTLFGGDTDETGIISQIIDLVFHGIKSNSTQAFNNTIVNPEGVPECKV